MFGRNTVTFTGDVHPVSISYCFVRNDVSVARAAHVSRGQGASSAARILSRAHRGPPPGLVSRMLVCLFKCTSSLHSHHVTIFLPYEPVCLSDHLSAFYKRFRYDGSDCQEGYRKHVHNESMYGENIYTSFLEVFVLLLFFACFLLSLFLFQPFHSSLLIIVLFLSIHPLIYLLNHLSFLPFYLYFSPTQR